MYSHSRVSSADVPSHLRAVRDDDDDDHHHHHDTLPCVLHINYKAAQTRMHTNSMFGETIHGHDSHMRFKN